MGKMKAAQYAEFHGEIKVVEVPLPSLPEDGVVIKVMATGVCRSDWHGWCGHDGDIKDHGLPFTPGHELSGVITQVGKEVKLFTVGARVAVPFILSCGSCWECSRGMRTVCRDQRQPGFTMAGSFAEYVAIPRADLNLSKLPEGVSFAQAAALGCRFTTAYRAVVQQGKVKKDDFVAVFGCGGVGLSAIMIAVHVGARVIAVDVSEKALTQAKSLGAIGVIDGKLDRDELVRQIENLTGERNGVDVSIDAAGFVSTCENAVWSAARGGRVIQVGLPLEVTPHIPMARVAGRELEIIGSHGMASNAFPEILSLVDKGGIRPELLVSKSVSLSEGAKILERMDTESPTGIVLITDLTA